MSSHWKNLYQGNVVGWNGSRWIVFEVDDDFIRLISFDSPNISACPSETFPTKKSGVASVVYLAESCKRYVADMLLKAGEML
jgi:hypothetical protein